MGWGYNDRVVTLSKISRLFIRQGPTPIHSNYGGGGVAASRLWRSNGLLTILGRVVYTILR